MEATDWLFSSCTESPDLQKNILLKCIKIASEYGLIVKAIICDQESNNQSMVTKLGASLSKPCFMNSNNSVIVFYDPPHLLKNIRNNLKKLGFKVGENNVLWQYIVSFYCSDSVLHVRMASKSTQKPVDFSVFSKMPVSSATRALIHSMAAGVSTHFTLG